MLDGSRPPSQRGASRVRILHGSLRLSSEPRSRLSKRVQQPVQQPRYRHLPGDAVTCSRRSSECVQLRPCAASGWDLKSAAPQGHTGSNPLPGTFSPSSNPAHSFSSNHRAALPQHHSRRCGTGGCCRSASSPSRRISRSPPCTPSNVASVDHRCASSVSSPRLSMSTRARLTSSAVSLSQSGRGWRLLARERQGHGFAAARTQSLPSGGACPRRGATRQIGQAAQPNASVATPAGRPTGQAAGAPSRRWAAIEQRASAPVLRPVWKTGRNYRQSG
jgi:hypothetical protein